MAGKRQVPGRRPATAGLLTGYCAAAAGALVAVAAGGTRHPVVALAILASVAAVAATRVAIPVAAACGVLAWLFYDGFIADRHAYLGWHGAADGWRLAICVGAALCGTALTRLLRARAGRRTGKAAAPATLARVPERRWAAGEAGLRSASSTAAAGRCDAVVVSLADARDRRSRSHADAS
jgi:hypothetical protein